MPILLVGGGSRSGKSSYALQLAAERGARKGFIATAQTFDDEMRERVRLHREERGSDYTTIEEPVAIEKALAELETKVDVIVLDCLTLWLSNLMLGEHKVDITKVLDRFAASPLPCILITNEVGCGIVPENPLARRFRDEAGRLNQQTAARATEVYGVMFGIPLRLK
ncbi:bifunctional adenosylcobinamide kinase/adenosylcobinamide-phosphate guanylyltransferase [Bryobacter aggregatus]|uniref:bifunctional adenosylcobinamide kinase/adenosylcobinamide-phosphate guanylyltransferase n=1 Tax=Bryobacter aggregatus TaxID=360054 RepID=UPI0004E0F32B|nr:bifunctional adenosylcobinamide kinase/adenosylcobinamide-phosphate guanylyltransferase [Bryobacter aggregatus]